MDSERTTKRRLTLVAGVLTVLLIACALVLKWPYNITTPCRFVPQYEWSLSQVAPERLLSSLVANNPYQVVDFKLLQFDRPDFVNYLLSRKLEPGGQIDKNALIATVFSHDNRLILESLEGQLALARANLDIVEAGEKNEILREAEQELRYAQSAFELLQPQVERKRRLYEDGLISSDEWEILLTESKLRELNVSIAQARLDVVKSGSKPEALNLYKIEMASLQEQIKSIQAKLATEEIRSPITGILLDNYAADTLCCVAKIDTMVVQMPLMQTQRGEVKPGAHVRIKIPALENKIVRGEIHSVGQNAQLIGGRMMFVVSGNIPNPEKIILPGFSGYATIYCGTKDIWSLANKWWVASRFFR